MKICKHGSRAPATTASSVPRRLSFWSIRQTIWNMYPASLFANTGSAGHFCFEGIMRGFRSSSTRTHDSMSLSLIKLLSLARILIFPVVALIVSEPRHVLSSWLVPRCFPKERALRFSKATNYSWKGCVNNTHNAYGWYVEINRMSRFPHSRFSRFHEL